MNVGPETSEQDSHAILDAAREAGVGFVDTADVYGWKRGEGWTELNLGRWFAQGGRRKRCARHQALRHDGRRAPRDRAVGDVGSSDFPGWGIAQANEQATSRGGLGL